MFAQSKKRRRNSDGTFKRLLLSERLSLGLKEVRQAA